jgi:hypothetical protein
MNRLRLGAMAARAHMIGSTNTGATTVRCVVALGLLIGLCISANAATVHRVKRPDGHSRPAQPVTVPKGYAVPGWTEEQTRYWLDSATGPKD